MLHPSTQQLIRKLCELTDAGHIAWKEGERQSSRFDSEGYLVEIEAEPPTLRLLRADGRELERADAADLAATAWPDGQGTYATYLTDMALKAHRVARGAEAAIARILSALSAPPKQDAEPLPAPDASAAPQPAPPSSPPPPHVAPPSKPVPAIQPQPSISIDADAPSTALAKPSFGAVESFARAADAEPVAGAPKAPDSPPPPPTAAPTVTHPPFMIKGFSARSVQTPETGAIPDTTPRPVQPPGKKPDAPPAVSVYKPWN